MMKNTDSKLYRILYSKIRNAAVPAASIMILFLMAVIAAGCINDTYLSEEEVIKVYENRYSEKDLGNDDEKVLKILTQNTMLIPFSFVAPAYTQRTYCVIELILEKYDIACLQEVFAGGSQNQIISAWHDKIYSDMSSGMPGNWQYDYFNDWYSSLERSREKMWQPLDSALDVEKLAEEESCNGVRVINSSPNNKDARLVCSPYYVMGPDSGWLPVQQDGGLVILSRYPITACSAFSFNTSSGTDKLAGKGVLYARIQIGPSEEDYIHVFNTHLQSHDYPGTRQEHIKELLDFVAGIIGPEGINSRPVLIMGDFNVTADTYENWMEISGIISPPDKYSTEDDPDSITIPSAEYREFNDKIKDFGETDPEGKLYLKDVWLELNPDDPGFTWIGGDWITGDKNSYGDLGNRIAIETDRPQRIDYIFYFGGSSEISIFPQSVYLVPREPEIMYCYDRRNLFFTGDDCVKEDKNSDCSFKSYTVSDHLGLEVYFDFQLDG